MTVVTMAIIGVIAGFVLDALIVRLAREPFERGELDEDVPPRADGAPLDLGSEVGAVEMPLLLTRGSMYRRAAVVALTATVFALLGGQYQGHDGYLAIVTFYAAALIICTATDVLSYRVPNAVTYPAIAGAFIIGALLPDANQLDVIVGGLMFGGLLFVPSVLTGGAMGMGDVKLAFFVGFALGLTYVVPAMLIMAIAGGVAAALLLVTRVRGKGDPIPYAPFIAGGAIVTMIIRGTAFYSV